jgi:hypothetical protein
MRDITDFFIIAFITGVVVVFGMVKARAEQLSRTSVAEDIGAGAVRKAS